VICYEAADSRETPNLMTRFREEHYATRAHMAWAKVQRTDNQGGPPPAEELARLGAVQERNALRSAYFKRKQQGKTSPHSAGRLLDAW